MYLCICILCSGRYKCTIVIDTIFFSMKQSGIFGAMKAKGQECNSEGQCVQMDRPN